MSLLDFFFKKKQQPKGSRYSPKIKQWLDNNVIYRYQATTASFEDTPRGGVHFTLGKPNPFYGPQGGLQGYGGANLIRKFKAANPDEIAVVGQASSVSSKYFLDSKQYSYERFQRNLPWDDLPKRNKNARRYLATTDMEPREISRFMFSYQNEHFSHFSMNLRERMGMELAKKAGFKAIQGTYDGENPYPEYLALNSSAIRDYVPVANRKYLGDARLTSINGLKKLGIGAAVRRAISDIRSPAAEAILRWVSQHSLTENPVMQQANKIRELAGSMYAKNASIYSAIKEHGGVIYAPNSYYYGDIPLFNENNQIIGRNILQKVIPGLHDENLSSIASSAGVSQNEVLDAIRGMERVPSTARGFYRQAASQLGLPAETISQANTYSKFSRFSAPLSELNSSALTSADIASNNAFGEYASYLTHPANGFSSGLQDMADQFRSVIGESPRLALGPGLAPKAPINANEFWKTGPFNGYKAAGIGAMIVAGVGLTSVLMAKHAAKSMAYENRDKRRKHSYRSTKSIQTAGIFGG